MNEYEARARSIKATKLITVLDRMYAGKAPLAAKIDAELVSRLDDKGWGTMARLAQVSMPSEETRQLVIDLLRAREDVVDPFDLFAGMGS